MKALKLLLGCYLVVSGLAAKAQSAITGYKLLNQTVTEYEKAEWNINIDGVFINPYDQKEVTLDLVLTAPSGNPVTLPCYFDNGVWKARFAPQEKGKYKYYFRLNAKAKSVDSKSSTFISEAGKRQGFLHKNDLYTFKFDNGDLFRGIGENVGWEARNFENPKYTYELLLPPLAKNGANFFRTWMCPWNLPLDYQKVNNLKRYSNTTEYYNPSGIKRMEELLHLCDSLHLYMMLTLDMNSGKQSEWFTGQASMDKYKNKLRYLVARWGYSTNIAAWEFFNEIDNGVFNKSDSVLIPHLYVTNWHDEMSRYLKDIDPYKHLVTTSISHRDIAGMNSIVYIDFNQKHIYKHTEKIPAIYPDYIKTYGKPYVVGEFGYRWEDANPKYAKEADYDYQRGLWFGLFSPTPILPMSWWWEFFHEENMEPYFRSVRAISDQMLTAGKGSFEQVNLSAGLLHGQAVKCGNTSFVYLLNESDDAVTTPITLNVGNYRNLSIQTLIPTTMQYNKLTGFMIKNNKLTFGQSLGGKQELVLIITAVR
ncbi:MAG: DUF5060 domain-containing protein [Bacteroidota bacterium]